MKKLHKLLILSAALFLGSSCSNDYLDTIPTDSTATGTIFENVTNMEMAVNGLYKRMVIQYSNFTTGYNNGEAVMKMWCGDIAGNYLGKGGNTLLKESGEVTERIGLGINSNVIVAVAVIGGVLIAVIGCIVVTSDYREKTGKNK